MRHQHRRMKDQSWVVGSGKLESRRHCMDGKLGGGGSPDLTAKQKGRERARRCTGKSPGATPGELWVTWAEVSICWFV